MARVASRRSRARKDGAAIPLDDPDQQLLNLMQGSFPLARAPVRARRRGWPSSPRTR